MLIQRDLLEKIKIFIKRREYLAIIGPRQCGKTVFLNLIKKYLINQKINNKNIKIISFENRRLMFEFENDPISFLKLYIENNQQKTYLMIDEFQYSKDGGQKLKLIFDQIKNLKIIITGSSSLDLKASLGKYMVGRVLSFNLYPFHFGEFLKSQKTELFRIYQKKEQEILNWLLNKKKRIILSNKKHAFSSRFLKLFNEYCVFGGYPAAAISKTKIEKQKILNDIYENYLIKDIKGLLELATDKNLILLTEFLAGQISNILIYQNLSQAAKLDYRNIIKHINILKQTYICDTLNPFYINAQKELSKNPKVYFLDAGLRNSLLKNYNHLGARPDTGSLVENQIWVKLKNIIGTHAKINFWRTKAGAEVDFVIRSQGEILPIEVKFSEFNQPKISKSFQAFIRSFQPKRGLILTKNYFGKKNINGCNVIFWPVYLI